MSHTTFPETETPPIQILTNETWIPTNHMRWCHKGSTRVLQQLSISSTTGEHRWCDVPTVYHE